MKRLQIQIEEELDEALAEEVSRTGMSKAALIRQFVRECLNEPRSTHSEPLDELVGAFDAEGADVDEVIYADPLGARPGPARRRG